MANHKEHHSLREAEEKLHKKLVKARETTWYEKLYKFGVGVKGFDGVVELLAGLWLLVAPDSLHGLLQFLFGHAVKHPSKFMQFIAEHIAHIDTELAAGGLLVVVIFLLAHGIVKIALVYCLMKEIVWAYPYALVVLGGFTVYQGYLFAVHPTLGMGLFTLIDLIIMWLVWGEWQKLKTKMPKKESQETHETHETE